MNTLKIEITAHAVAWYGAIVATCSLVISTLNAWRDRARLSVRVQRNMVALTGSPTDSEQTYLLVTVANRGRRPVTIDKVWFEQEAEQSPKWLVKDSLTQGPREVTEGKSVTYMAENGQFDLSIARWVCIGLATGQTIRSELTRALNS